jgi:hypothetical protein
MPNDQISAGQTAVVGVFGEGALLGSLSASTDNYAAAYVAKVQPDTSVQAYYQVVPKLTPGGPTVTVTVTLTGTSMNGTALPTVTKSFDCLQPAAPAQATGILQSPSNLTFAPLAPDPGSATVVLI